MEKWVNWADTLEAIRDGRLEIGDKNFNHMHDDRSNLTVYMHDGSLATLEAVVRFYAAGGVPHEGLDPRVRPHPRCGRSQGVGRGQEARFRSGFR